MQEMTEICTSASLYHKAQGILYKNQHTFTLKVTLGYQTIYLNNLKH